MGYRIRSGLAGDHLGIDEVVLEDLADLALLILNDLAHVDEWSEIGADLIRFGSLMRGVLGKFLLRLLGNVRIICLI